MEPLFTLLTIQTGRFGRNGIRAIGPVAKINYPASLTAKGEMFSVPLHRLPAYRTKELLSHPIGTIMAQ